MLTFEVERPGDARAREALLDRCFDAGRHRKTVARLRRGRRPADGLALVARLDGAVVATNRLWDVAAGTAGAALLLGPIAVDPALQGSGIGTALMRESLTRATAYGHRAILLVGDEPYYRRFGFTRAAVGGLTLPGPVDPARFLGLSLAGGALDGAAGPIVATGRLLPQARRRAA